MSEAENELDNVNDTLNTDDPADNGGKRKRRLKGGHIALIVIGALLVLILAAVLTVTLIYHRYLNKINYTHDPYDPFDTAEIPIDSLPPEYFVTEFGRRIYEQFIDINQSGQEIDVTQLTPRFSETEGSEIVRILNSDEASAIGDLDTLIDVITTEHFKPKPQEAANLSEDELLMQMSRLKKLKK